MSFAAAATRSLRTGLAVSQLGLGTTPFGNLFSEVSDLAIRETMAAARGAGIRYFDTAPFYGHGLAEHRLGEALRTAPRGDFVISTKVGRILKPDPGAVTPGTFARILPFGFDYDYSYDGAMRSFEDSLQRLGLATVDIALIHDVNRRWQGERLEKSYAESMNGAYRALAKLRSERVVNAIGVGINENDLLIRYACDGDFDCFMLAGRYTLLDHSAIDELLPECVKRGIGILLAAPLSSGILATGAKPGATYLYDEASPEIMERARGLARICAGHGVGLRAAALQFPLHHPAIMSVPAGMRAVHEVTQNVADMGASIPAALWQELKHAGLIDRACPTP